MSVKRIVICTSQIPFVYGGAELQAECLQRELAARGYVVDMVRIPFRWYPKEEILKGYLAWRLIDLTESEGQKIDLVIPMKFPAFAVRHPNKVTWLIQQFRQAYDLFGTQWSHFTHDPADTRLRQVIREIDTLTLAESRHIFTISHNTADRLASYNGLQGELLYTPPPHEGLYHHDSYGDYVLVVSRLNVLKRVHLIIEAMAHVRSKVRCLIAGEGPEEAALKRLTQERGLAGQVEFLGYVDDARVIDLYANALAVFYGPYDEDYGLATVEAFKSHKPVLTVTDSGGVLEFVQEGVTGYVVPPGKAEMLAERIDQLYADRALCRELGEAGYASVQDITWERTIARLLEK
jgi:glycosyltransferase involved in cell wall biosynthesis